MRFGSFFAAGFAALAAAAATPEQIVTGINVLTQKTSALQGPAQSITILNAPLIIIGQGPFPQIIAGYSDLVSTTNTLSAQIGTGAERRALEIREDGGAIVRDAFRTFVRVSQATLNILIGKAGLLEKVPLVGPPVAAVLRAYEASLDNLSIQLISTFASVSADLTNEANSLSATLELAIQKYEGLQI
ncbi:hypothetical protein CCM_08669 [Cordyceps militaris CM01]|uniref:Uncharacterized protein n=1 Tax=Cordyceps militaris (strain CM01) TaxID=983644 RepID=G3JRX8_CORMM|nr:uncharacterized protein CCM_08669 [Cordyceps militaris CM01]EGX88624.1 hypothetical protein CCM_08669 [Cordyceps militaris CM01]